MKNIGSSQHNENADLFESLSHHLEASASGQDPASWPFAFLPHADMPEELITRLWFALNRLSGYALLNLLDDPAILALAFC